VPSYLFESVQNGSDTGRYSFVGASPCLEVLAKGTEVTILDHASSERTVAQEPDPVEVCCHWPMCWLPSMQVPPCTVCAARGCDGLGLPYDRRQFQAAEMFNTRIVSMQYPNIIRKIGLSFI
jgi:anthranilate/para-aminobenzoate synthase component I